MELKKHNDAFDCLATILAAKLSAVDAWNKFIDFHEQTTPKLDWTALRQLDINGEQAVLVDWLQEMVAADPIPESVVALWFGLLKFAEDDKEIPAMYMIGADTYDKEDIDWACDPTYLPENRYFQPELLQQIDYVAKTDEDNYGFLDRILPLAYCTFTFDELIRTKLDRKVFLRNRSKLFVTVGHDSGDHVDLSSIE